MKAIVWTQYGPPEVLQFKEVAKPAPKDNEVLVKVHAASVNTLDLAMRGPLLARIITGGLLKPKTRDSELTWRVGLKRSAAPSRSFSPVTKSLGGGWALLPSMRVLVKIPWC